MHINFLDNERTALTNFFRIYFYGDFLDNPSDINEALEEYLKSEEDHNGANLLAGATTLLNAPDYVEDEVIELVERAWKSEGNAKALSYTYKDILSRIVDGLSKQAIDMDDQEIKEKLEAIWPEVIGAVVTKRNDTVNLCPINYQAVSTVYEKPLSVCLGLDNKNHTLKTILQASEFVYAYPSKSQLRDVLYCGTVSGRDGDKLGQTKLQFSPSEKVEPPNLVGAVLNYECKLLHHYNVGQFTIVIGEILKVVESDKSNLDKIYALGGTRYGAIKAVEVLQDRII